MAQGGQGRLQFLKSYIVLDMGTPFALSAGWTAHLVIFIFTRSCALSVSAGSLQGECSGPPECCLSPVCVFAEDIQYLNPFMGS